MGCIDRIFLFHCLRNLIIVCTPGDHSPEYFFFNFSLIPPHNLEINGLDIGTDGQQSDPMRVSLLPELYAHTLRKQKKIYRNNNYKFDVDSIPGK